MMRPSQKSRVEATMKRIGVFVLALLAALPVPAPAQSAPPSELERAAAAELPALLELYRHLHTHPELSYQEEKTAALLAERMRGLGFEVTERVGRYSDGRQAFGVVAVLRNGEGPTVMLRTDTDALPVEEQTGLEFASRARATQDGVEVPVMHACGHDVHMTVWLGTARLLAGMRDRWQGTLVMIAQPAEERGAGAPAMLADGLFTRFPRPDAAIALHVSAMLPAGVVGPREGYILASTDSVDVTFYGVGGHGAWPHATRDPVVMAAQFVVAVQTVVSRSAPPLEPAVITVGSIHAGAKHNIISDRAHLQLTVRSYDPEVRRTLLEGIERVARGTAIAAGAERMPEVRISGDEGTPSTYNDPELTRRIADAMRTALGDDRVVEGMRTMGGEDFSYFGRTEPRVPISIFWLGTIEPEVFRRSEAGEVTLPSLHSPFYAPDAEPSIRTGIAALVASALEVVGKK
jgi:amidohydrolase